VKQIVKNFVKKILEVSLKSTIKERNQVSLKNKLMQIVPDVSDQYTAEETDMNDTYVVHKIYNQHTFQMALFEKALDMSDKIKNTIVDIGDSAGTNLLYLNGIYKESNKELTTLSVNLDSVAIEKIRAKGLNAELCRAEELHVNFPELKADIFSSFEMLEHLFNPISFMHNMAIEAECDYFVVTVPYVKQSRMGKHMTGTFPEKGTNAENTHIFELSPKDWDIIFNFSGWKVLHRDHYTQYPKWNILNMSKYIWRKIDVDGFYGVILEKDLTLASRYKDW
jgi:hypothetical protein